MAQGGSADKCVLHEWDCEPEGGTAEPLKSVCLRIKAVVCFLPPHPQKANALEPHTCSHLRHQQLQPICKGVALATAVLHILACPHILLPQPVAHTSGWQAVAVKKQMTGDKHLAVGQVAHRCWRQFAVPVFTSCCCPF